MQLIQWIGADDSEADKRPAVNSDQDNLIVSKIVNNTIDKNLEPRMQRRIADFAKLAQSIDHTA